MGILDNFEEYFEARFNAKSDLCHYCENKAKYDDITQNADAAYEIIGVCQCHFVQEVTS